jgi:hypothetical protein
LEYDFRAFWRRAFIGIVFLECDNYVVETNDELKGLLHHRLLRIDDFDMVTTISGPQIPGGDSGALPAATNVGVIAMEWSNALAFAMQRQGHKVNCFFTLGEADTAQPIPNDAKQMLEVELTVRQMFEDESAAPAVDLLTPGELTQGLCSPWQHDYRECSCYYWPATRPDFVNIEPSPDGVSRGDNWLSKDRTGEYVLDDRADSRLVTYGELFTEWEKNLRFQIKGRDAEES